MGVSLAIARVGLFRTTRSLRCCAIALHCLTACSIALTQQPFDVLHDFYTYLCYTLFNSDYRILIRLKFFTLFELCLFLSCFVFIFKYVQG
ncbi:MAG: hypothetical protein NZ455_05615 [Bacteroidia bacterium]|nr:hypothetical protein [Bacteroidia bacterium]MDW8346274.1 hypothetical protein [Bacteroidia bacterium]